MSDDVLSWGKRDSGRERKRVVVATKFSSLPKQRKQGGPTKSPERSSVERSTERGRSISKDNSKTEDNSGGPSDVVNKVSVSDLLSQTNAKVYNCDDTSDCVFVEDSVIANSVMASGPDKVCLTSNNNDSSNALIVEYLKKIDNKLGNMDGRMSGIEKRLDSGERKRYVKGPFSLPSVTVTATISFSVTYQKMQHKPTKPGTTTLEISYKTSLS